MRRSCSDGTKREHGLNPPHSRLLRSVAIGLVVAISVAACGSPEDRRFETALPTSDYDPLPVVLRDETGLVLGIEPARFDPQGPGELRVEADPIDRAALLVSWLGGLCEGDAALTFWRSDSTYALHLAISRKPGTGCPALGVGRALRITTSSPIPADSILVSGGAGN